jgi:putative colanic acid biosynthesis acetyltransferase WcaF
MDPVNRLLNKTQLCKSFDKQNFDPGASRFRICCWYMVSLLFFRSGLMPFSNVMVFILRLFGAQIGKEVRIKPSIYIRYPWKLFIGDHCWLADCYLDNLDYLYIGENVCISQQAMILTGNHDYTNPGFHLFTRPVTLEDGVWIASRAVVCPGVKAHSHAMLQVAAVAHTDLLANTIYCGSPALAIRKRKITASRSAPRLDDD